jgi:hypothetical protein
MSPNALNLTTAVATATLGKMNEQTRKEAEIQEVAKAHISLPRDPAICVIRGAPDKETSNLITFIEVVPSFEDLDAGEVAKAVYFTPGGGFHYPSRIYSGSLGAMKEAIVQSEELRYLVANGVVIEQDENRTADSLQSFARETTKSN